jgi:hypothetical protein
VWDEFRNWLMSASALRASAFAVRATAGQVGVTDFANSIGLAKTKPAEGGRSLAGCMGRGSQLAD